MVEPFTVERLMARSAEAEAAGDSILARQELQRALWLEKSGRNEAYFIGGVDPMPRFRKGEVITIKKGTVIYGTFPDSLAERDSYGRPFRIAKRTYRVKVSHTYRGNMEQDWGHKTNGVGARVINPVAVFSSAGSYWGEVDLNQVPEAIEKLKIGDVEPERRPSAAEIRAARSASGEPPAEEDLASPRP